MELTVRASGNCPGLLSFVDTDMESPLREHLLELLGKGGAHADYDRAVAEFPEPLRGVRPPGVPHTGWRLVEHMRIVQADILAFCRDARHASPPWPDGYWPTGDAPAASADWDQSIAAFQEDRRSMLDLVSGGDLLRPLPYGQGQTLAREAMLVADHNSYHLGQLILLREVLGCWSG